MCPFFQKGVKAVSDSRQPHRRRRPQGTPQIPAEEIPAEQIPDEEKTMPRPQGNEIPREMHRIVITDGDQPDWMVSANRVSGAAERRGAPAAKAVQPEMKTEKQSTPRTQSRADAPAKKPEERKTPHVFAPKKAKSEKNNSEIFVTPKKTDKTKNPTKTACVINFSCLFVVIDIIYYLLIYSLSIFFIPLKKGISYQTISYKI